MHCLPLLDPAPLVVGTAVGLVVGTTVGVLSLAVGTTVFLLVGTWGSVYDVCGPCSQAPVLFH